MCRVHSMQYDKPLAFLAKAYVNAPRVCISVHLLTLDPLRFLVCSNVWTKIELFDITYGERDLIFVVCFRCEILCFVCVLAD